MSENQVSVLLRAPNGDEATIIGSPDLLGRFMKAYMPNADSVVEEFEAAGSSTERITRPPVVVDLPVSQEAVAEVKPAELLEFFRRVNPQTQPDEIMVITYFYQKHAGFESLSLHDYEQAYAMLKRIPVETPKNMKSSVRNVVDRTKYMRNSTRGRFMLTLLGEEHVDRLINKEPSSS